MERSWVYILPRESGSQRVRSLVMVSEGRGTPCCECCVGGVAVGSVWPFRSVWRFGGVRVVIPSLGPVVLASGVLVGVAPERASLRATGSGSAAFLAVIVIVIVIVITGEDGHPQGCDDTGASEGGGGGAHDA